MKKLMKNNGKLWGLVFIALAFIILYLRPFQDCSWYNLFCQAGAGASSIIIYPIFFILLIIGIRRLIKK